METNVNLVSNTGDKLETYRCVRVVALRLCERIQALRLVADKACHLRVLSSGAGSALGVSRTVDAEGLVTIDDDCVA